MCIRDRAEEAPRRGRWSPPGPCSDSARAGDLGAWVDRPWVGGHRDRPGALRNCARPRGSPTWRRRPCQSRDAPPSHRPPRRSPSDRHRHPTVRRGPSRRRPRLNQDQPLNTWVGSVLVTPWGAASVAARRSPSDRQARRSPSDRQARRDDPHPIVRRGDPHPIVKGTQPPRRARRSPSDRHAPIVTRPSARRWCPPGPCSDSARAGDLGAWVDRPWVGGHLSLIHISEPTRPY